MLNNLKIEWLKLSRYRTFWALSILYVVSMICGTYLTYQFKMEMGTNQVAKMALGNPFAFPDIWQTVTYVCSFALFLPGFLMVILITNEFNFRTHRQNVIDGISRSEFAQTKLALAFIVSIISAILVALITIITGLMVGDGGLSFVGSENILYYFIQALSYCFAGLLFGFLLKRSGIAIALFFIYLIFFKNLISFLADKYLDKIGAYFPIKSADSLIGFPFAKNISKQFFEAPNVSLLIVMSIVYLLGFYFIIVKKYTTQDL